jgi:hypothetical protein
MENRLREAWQHTIQPEDYDAHMAAVGQAQANAHLIADLFARHPPSADAHILFAGAGTGQMFDFISPAVLSPYRTTFTDISEEFLRRLSSRLEPVPGLRHENASGRYRSIAFGRRLRTRHRRARSRAR